jgi:hypothetical protein
VNAGAAAIEAGTAQQRASLQDLKTRAGLQLDDPGDQPINAGEAERLATSYAGEALRQHVLVNQCVATGLDGLDAAVSIARAVERLGSDKGKKKPPPG